MDFFQKIAKLFGFGGKTEEPVVIDVVKDEPIEVVQVPVVEEVVTEKPKKVRRYKPKSNKPKVEDTPSEPLKKPKRPFRRKPKPKKPTE